MIRPTELALHASVEDARRWCEGRDRAVLLDVDAYDALGVTTSAAAAACAAAARSLYSAGYDVAVRADPGPEWDRRLGPLLAPSPRTVRRIEGGGVVLRAWEPGDVGWVHEACQDDDIARWTNIPWPYGEDDARSLVALSEHGRRMRTAALFAVTTPDGEPLGSAGLTFGDADSDGAEVGYWIAPGGRRRGAATAAVKVLTAWALGELGFARVALKTIVGNEGSERVAAGAGFEREGVLRSAHSHRGERVDVVSWSRTAPPGSGRSPGPGGTTQPGSA